MEINPLSIYEEYINGTAFKSAIGSKGLYEQNKINERFFIGDQWYGAKCGNERPLVRHNVIKRIGEYKMSQILNNPFEVLFSADGIPKSNKKVELLGENTDLMNSSTLGEDEINSMMSVFDNYFKTTSERVDLSSLTGKALRNAYITGTAVLYTYWDPHVPTGLFADKEKKIPLKGDICSEVLNVDDIVFGDPYRESVQEQPYIIISSRKSIDEVIKEARIFGGDIKTLQNLSDEARSDKITVLTKLWKNYNADGSISVMSAKVTETSVVRQTFNTGLTLYPLCLFKWDSKNNCIYGESEVTYLIPNQIAINRMITANVWSAMTNGMPIMLVNGDTVTDKITNDPGQIIKVYGTNEDVEGAVKYVTSPSFMKEFDESINSLINNTLTQSGANEVALGDSKADNASALATMRTAALSPLQVIKRRYYGFIEDLARIWADFWVCYYGKRQIKISSDKNIGYVNLNFERYKGLVISSRVDVNSATEYSPEVCFENLIKLFEKGIINRSQLLKRIPEGMISNIEELLYESEENGNDGI